MAKIENTINVSMDEVWAMIKEKYNVDDKAQCKPIIKTVWKGDQRDGYYEHTLESLQLKYDG